MEDICFSEDTNRTIITLSMESVTDGWLGIAMYDQRVVSSNLARVICLVLGKVFYS